MATNTGTYGGPSGINLLQSFSSGLVLIIFIISVAVNPIGHTQPSEAPVSEISLTESPTEQLDYTLKILYHPDTASEPQANVDIVAVHGLQADADETWRTGLSKGKEKETGSKEKHTANFGVSKSKSIDSSPRKEPALSKDTPPNEPSEAPRSLLSKEVNWLKDPHMLPEAYPKARIMTFGYSATPASSEESLDDALLRIAEQLLQRLDKARGPPNEASGRPVIFIGHRFGGIVIEKALVLARSMKHDDIMEATVGIIFLSTRFQRYKATTRSVGPGQSNRISQIFSTRSTRPSGASRPAPPPGGVNAEFGSASGKGGNAPKLASGKLSYDLPNPEVAGQSSLLPVLVQPTKLGSPDIRQLLESPDSSKTLGDLFNGFIQQIRMEHIRMTCFVDEKPTGTTQTYLQVSHFI